MNEVVITDVTLREYGQNVPASYLHVFTPRIRTDIALRLIGAGFRSIEVISCVQPRIAPAMNAEDVRRIAEGLGRLEGAHLITLVPNLSGYRRYLDWNLGPDGHNHTLGMFFSAVEAHNLLNLGRTIEETLNEYRAILKDALQRKVRVAVYISAAFGYRVNPGGEVLKPGGEALNAHVDRFLDRGAETVTLSDLQGVAGEAETREVLETVLGNRKRETVERLGYHPHHVRGDRGIANSKVAYEMGIRRFDASLGGTGGCVTGAPGNQPTEGLLEAFERMGVGTGIDLEEVRKIGRLVEKELYARIGLKSME